MITVLTKPATAAAQQLATLWQFVFGSLFLAQAPTAGSNPVISVDWAQGRTQLVKLAHSRTATISIYNGVAGGTYRLVLLQDGSGGHAVNYSIQGARWPIGFTPAQNTGANNKDVLVFVHDGQDYLAEMASF